MKLVLASNNRGKLAELQAMLAPLGMPIIELDTSEYRKMDGGLTCLSLRLETPLS